MPRFEAICHDGVMIATTIGSIVITCQAVFNREEGQAMAVGEFVTYCIYASYD